MRSLVAAMCIALSAGCGGGEAPARLATGDARIADLRVQETGSTLQITALDAQRAPLAQLSLEATAAGRRIYVVAGDASATHESTGHGSLALPALSGEGGAQLNAFLRDSRVAAALQRWGVSLGGAGKETPEQERQSFFPACSYKTSASCGATSCCQWPGYPAVEEVCCAGAEEFVLRLCTFANDANNPCGQAGPGGCAVCWSTPYQQSCEVRSDCLVELH